MAEKGVDVRTRTVIFNEAGEVLVQHHPAETDDFYRLPGGVSSSENRSRIASFARLGKKLVWL